MRIEEAVNSYERLILDAQTDIIDHPYITLLDLREVEKASIKKKDKIAQHLLRQKKSERSERKSREHYKIC